MGEFRKTFPSFAIIILVLFQVAFHRGTSCAHSTPGPESDRHNTVYSYNISEVSLDAHHKLHVTMTVHMCPFCSPYNNYVKVTIPGLGDKYVRNTPVGSTYTYTFTFDADSLKIGDIVNISSVVWCEWCGSWRDKASYKVEKKIDQAAGLGSKCEMTLVRIGSSVNVANGNMYDSHQISLKPGLTLHYNSQSNQDGRFGVGWTDSADIQLLRTKKGDIIFIGRDGREELFTADTDGTFVSPPGNHDKLSLNKQLLFSDDMENGQGSWSADAPWGRVSFAHHSGLTSWTDSPNGTYANNIHKSLTMPLDLSGSVQATLTFWHKFALERNYDYGYIEISSNGGANWTMLKSYNGFQNDWAEQTVNLDAYIGLSNLLLRFRLITDSSVVYDGWYIDDVEISNTAGYILQRKNGTMISFDDKGFPSRIVDRNGNISSYNYLDEVLSSVETSDGYALRFTIDNNGLVTGVDTAAHSFSFDYDESGNLASIINGDEGIWSFSYDDDHNLIYKTDPMGNTTHYEYDDYDRLISATDAEGNASSISYVDESTTNITDPAGNRTDFTFNNNLNVTRKVDSMGNVTEYGWDENVNKIFTRDSSGEISYNYDEMGNLLEKTDQAGNTTTYTYDSHGNILTKTDPGGGVTHNIYDERGNLLSTTGPTGSVVQYKYDPQGHILSTKDSGGRQTSFSYDNLGNLISITNPAGATTTMAYDSAGRMITKTDTNGNATAYEYDSLGRLITVTDPFGNVTNYTYDKNGNRTSVIDANGNATLFGYNQRGNIVTMTDALGNVTTYQYTYGGCSSCGSSNGDLLASVTDPNGHTVRYEYDGLGRKTKQIDPKGETTLFSYDAKGNLVTVSDGNGHVSTFTYDQLSRPVELTDPLQGVTSLSYDALGRTKTVTDANGIRTQYEYDAAGKVVQVISLDAGTTSYVYNADGSLKTKKDANGTITSYVYDSAGRLSAIQFPDPSENITYEYDTCANGKGRLCSVSDPAGNTAYEYDELGRVEYQTETILGVEYTTTYGYDKVGELKAVVYPSGRKVSYAYDQINRPVAIQAKLGRTTSVATDLIYDPAGNLTSLTFGNGLPQTFNYDQANRIAGINVPDIMSFDYTYDSVGNITSITDKLHTDLSKTFVYDKLDRLIDSTGPWGAMKWHYDVNGNRLTQTGTDTSTYTYAGNRLMEISNDQTRHYKYDNNGSTTYDGTREFVYNQNNRLIKTLIDGKTVGEYTYNVSGQRVIKKTGPAAPNGASRHNTVYHFDITGKLIEETAGNGKLLADYIYSDTGLLAMVRQQGNGEEIFYYHNDHLGTPKVMTDKLQRVVWNIEFDPFGNELEQKGRHGSFIRNVENNIRFPGQYFDAESGLHQNWHRYYDPATGRYVSADPIGLAGGVNLYGYVGGDPVDWMDPRGLAVWDETAYVYWNSKGTSGGVGQAMFSATMTGLVDIAKFLDMAISDDRNVDMECVKKCMTNRWKSLAGAGVAGTGAIWANLKPWSKFQGRELNTLKKALRWNNIKKWFSGRGVSPFTSFDKKYPNFRWSNSKGGLSISRGGAVKTLGRIGTGAAIIGSAAAGVAIGTLIDCAVNCECPTN